MNVQSINTHDVVLKIAGFYCLAFNVSCFCSSFVPYIRVACTFSTYSTFSQEVFRFFSLDFVKQRSLAGELVSRCIWLRRIERFSFECRKVIGFAFTTLRDWLKKLAPLFHPISSKTKTNRDSLVGVFPQFASATCNYFVFWLVHLIICVLCDWLEWLIWFWFYDTQLKTALTNQYNTVQRTLWWLRLCCYFFNFRQLSVCQCIQTDLDHQQVGAAFTLEFLWTLT